MSPRDGEGKGERKGGGGGPRTGKPQRESGPCPTPPCQRGERDPQPGRCQCWALQTPSRQPARGGHGRTQGGAPEKFQHHPRTLLTSATNFAASNVSGRPLIRLRGTYGTQVEGSLRGVVPVLPDRRRSFSTVKEGAKCWAKAAQTSRPDDASL